MFDAKRLLDQFLGGQEGQTGKALANQMIAFNAKISEVFYIF